MERLLSSVIIICALGLTEVQAQEAASPLNPPSSSSCGSLTDNCRTLSLGADENSDLCSCKNICASAQKACLEANDKTNLDTASLYALYCKKACKKYKKNEQKKDSSSTTGK